MVAAGSTLFIDLGTSGIYKYSAGALSKISSTMNPKSMVAVGDDMYFDLGASGLYKYSSGALSKVIQASPYNSNLTTRLQSKTLSSPDANGNIYYHYINEDWNNQGYGRPDVAKRQDADSYGNLAYSLAYASSDSPIKIKGYSDAGMTQLNRIYTFYDYANNKIESETLMDDRGPGGSFVMISYTNYNDADNRLEQDIFASPDQNGFVYWRRMNEGFYDNSTPGDTSDDYGRITFASMGDNGLTWQASEDVTRTYRSLMYTYYADSSQIHFMYVYEDKYWNDYLGRVVYDLSNNPSLDDLAAPTYPVSAENAPIPNLGDQGEFDQRAAVQAKVQSYGTTSAGGFTFTSALAGETPGVNPFNGQQL
jgi:hypothetical protein